MRVLILAVGAAAAVVLFLLLRPGGDEEAAPEPAATTNKASQPPPAPTASASVPAQSPATPAAPPSPPPNPSVATIRISIRDGQPRGGVQRVSVEEGRRVRIVVRSDVADHVHLHGYDIFRDVAPGKPAQIAVRATLTGRFEVELEDRGLQIAELEVLP
jgi:hypothetical protein